MRPVSYTWDNAMVEGRRRLALLEHSLDPSTFRRLEGHWCRAGMAMSRCRGRGRDRLRVAV